MRHVVDIVLAVSALSMALLGILRPVVIVRWAKQAHPELRENDETLLSITRLIGVGGLCIALFFLVIVIRSFSFSD